MTVLTFNVTEFRLQFPAFANPDQYSDVRLQMYWDMATCYISPNDYGVLHGSCRQTALNLMVAHLAVLGDQLNASMTPGQLNAATIDKVSVTLTPPPNPNQWEWWLGTTGYGMQLLALLQSIAVGGIYGDALPETGAFRRVGGIFI